jgi:hypothetical protein
MTYETYVNYLQFNGGQGLTVNHASSLNLNDLTVFLVARSSSTETGKTIVSKTSASTGWHSTGWQLGWTNNNQLGFTIKRSNTSNIVTAASGVALDDDWHILTAKSDLSFKIDSQESTKLNRTIGNITNTNSLTIGFNGSSSYSTVDIAEIIVYNGILSADDEYKVNMYLKNKYNPESLDVSIYALKPITGSAVVGESYALPSVLRAYMTNGTMMDVPVTWSENLINTSTAGLKTSVATAISDPSKTTTAKIDVAGISSLNDIYQ